MKVWSVEAIVSFCICVFAFHGLCIADGVVRDAVGAVTIGRGGANIAFADNGQMILDNPSSLVNMSSMRLSEFGIDVLFTDLDFSDPDNPRANAADNPFPMGQLSVTSKSHSGNLAYGIGVFSHAGFSSEYQLNGPVPFSGPQNYMSIGALIRVLPAVSLRVTDRLSIGGNFGVGISHMELEGPYFLQGPNPFVGTPNQLDFQGTGAAISWATGLQYLLTPQTTIGINYQAATEFDLDGSTSVAIPGLGSSRFDSNLNITWPQTLGFGVKHEVNCCTRVGLDLVWFDWSNSFDAFDLTLTDPNNPTFAAVVGNELFEQFPLRWRDTLSVRTGFERNLPGGRIFRAGYVYHRNPIPAATLTPFIQTTLEHAFSVGYGWQAMGHQIDVAYQYTFADDQEVGVSQFVGGDFNNSVVGTQAHMLSISSIRRF